MFLINGKRSCPLTGWISRRSFGTSVSVQSGGNLDDGSFPDLERVSGGERESEGNNS